MSATRGELLRESLRRRFSRSSAPRRALRSLGRARKRVRRAWRVPVAQLLSRILPRSVMRDRRFFSLWERRGFHALPIHFYSPVPDTRELVEASWPAPSQTVGIDWNDSAQQELLARFVRDFKREYDRFPRERVDEPDAFSLANGSFGPVDAELLYCMVRCFKPRRVVEIGSGNSTLLAAQALRLNETEGHKGELIAIEPYPDARLRRGFPGLSRVIARPVQQVALDEFTALGPDDILFIDSSHVLKAGSDVRYEMLEILPRLRPGVLVHLHDVFLPAEYPRDWVVGAHLFFNEQYALQAFLSFNSCFEVLWGGNYMLLNHPEALRAAFQQPPDQPLTGGGSFWMRRIEPRS